MYILIDSGSPVVKLRSDTTDLFSTLSPVSRNIGTAAKNGELVISAEYTVGAFSLLRIFVRI